MGSKVSVKHPRLKRAEYEALKASIDRDYFYNFFLVNGNDEVCKKFDVGLNVLLRLIKDFDIVLTPEQKKQRNTIATKQKVFEKYGVTSIFQHPDMQERIKETNMQKYGVSNPFAATEIKEKIKNTNKKKYGVEYAPQNPQVIEKMKQTCLQKYGVDNYAKTSECQEKMRNTLLLRYGDTTVGQFGSPQYKASVKAHYGVEYAPQNPQVIEKMKQTCLQKYGVARFSQTPQHQQQLRARYLYKDMHFDSLPELAVYKYFEDLGVDISRVSEPFTYMYEDKVCFYFPDFDISGRLVEIKGDQFFKADGTMCNPFDHSLDAQYEAKHQCMLKNGVEIWRAQDYQKYLNYFNEHYDKNNFKVN